MNKRKIKFSRLDLGNKYINTLNEIGHELAYNYLTNSFGDTDQKEIKSKRIIQDSELQESLEKRNFQKCRNILIVGAGASKDAYRELPLGNDMIEGLKSKFVTGISKVGFLNEKYEQLIAETKSLSKYGLDFENFLYVLSNSFVTKTDLREEIAKYTEFRHCPSLFYEIVSHLLNHSFLDAVINFNFEEILDQAIEDEIDKQNYKFVLSDGDCADLSNLIVDGRIKTPLYIKPHGTASHKSSLRFTKRHYLDLPSDIKELLRQLFSGYRGNTKPIQRVNLFVFGFNMSSIEFNEIIDNDLPPESRVYHFGWGVNESKNELFPTLFPKLKDKTEKEGVKMETLYQYFPLELLLKAKSDNELTSPLGEVSAYIWRNTHMRFREFYKPRSISRHELTSYLFQKGDVNYYHINEKGEKKAKENNLDTLGEHYDYSPKYFRDRIIVEIALELNRSKGIVDIVDALSSDKRIGKYYSIFKEKCTTHGDKIKIPMSIYDLFNEFVPSESKTDDQNFESEEFEFANNIFRIKEVDFSKSAWKEKLLDTWRYIEFKSGKRNPDNENSDTDDAFAMELINIFLEHYNSDSENNGNKINLSILFYLFSSSLLSNTFKVRLLEKIRQPVYNGLVTTEEESSTYSRTIIPEIFRLFLKSSKSQSHYYYIRPRYNDSKHHMWESFNKNKLIHTNLALNYDFQRMFLDTKWNLLLVTLETSEVVKKIVETLIEEEEQNELDVNGKKVLESIRKGERRIISINAYSAISQLHKSDEQNIEEENQDINEIFCNLIEKHKKFLNVKDPKSASGEGIWKDETLDVMLLPTNQHNHHSIMFLNTKHDITMDTIGEGFSRLARSVTGCLYMYRRGFSHSISPVFIGQEYYETPNDKIFKDIIKSLKLFFTYLCRADEFKYDSTEDKQSCSSSLQSVFDTIREQYANANGYKFFDSTIFNRAYKVFEEEILKDSEPEVHN